MAPHQCFKLAPILSKLSQSAPNNSMKKLLQTSWYQLSNLASGRGDLDEINNWRYLSPVPTYEELLGDPMAKSSHLRAVHMSQPYVDEEEYMNVYYPAMRTEAYSALQVTKCLKCVNLLLIDYF